MDPDVDKMEKYFLERFQIRFDVQSRLSLFFMLTGEKPGARVMFIDESKKEIVEDFCDEFDLEYRSFETDLHHKYYITTREEIFDYLERMDKEEPYFTKRSEGKFLGYPNSAIDYFVENSGSHDLGRELNGKVDEMLEKGRIEEENLYLPDLVLFKPAATDRGVLQAMEIGEKRKEQLMRFDRKNNSKLGEKLLEEVRNNSEPYFRDFY